MDNKYDMFHNLSKIMIYIKLCAAYIHMLYFDYILYVNITTANCF